MTIPTALNPLAVRDAFGKTALQAPEPFTPDGWRLFPTYAGGILITLSRHADILGTPRTLATISHPDRVPEPDEIALLRRVVFGAAPVEITETLETSVTDLHDHAVFILEV